MSTHPIVAIIVALILLVFLGVAFVVYKHRGKRPETDYRVFFILGLTWLPLGIAMDNPAFWGMGAVFLMVALTNRDKWKATNTWSELSPTQRNLMLVAVGLGLALLAATAIAVGIFVRS